MNLQDFFTVSGSSYEEIHKNMPDPCGSHGSYGRRALCSGNRYGSRLEVCAVCSSGFGSSLGTL